MDTTRFQFCPTCGAALTPGQDTRQPSACANCDGVFYSAPHPTASAIIVDDSGQRVLLARRNVEPFAGHWDTPGGFVEVGETCEDGLRRELWEELGVEVRIDRYLDSFADVYGEGGTPTLNLFFVARIASGDPRPDSDVSALEWFSRDGLPSGIAFDCCGQALERWRIGE